MDTRGTIVALIPARGGSKRIPGKNILDFCGKPMIAWSIEAAWASGCFQRVIVSTDDQDIAAVAKEWGAEVPFLRPQELADDFTPTRAVINHAIREIAATQGLPGFVCCLYPTAPFVQATDISTGLETLMGAEADFAFTVTTFPHPIQRALRITAEGRLSMFFPENAGARSQDLEQAYHDAAQFYWGRAQAFLDDVPLFGETSVPIVLPRFRVQDIDTQEDWDRAVLMFRILADLRTAHD